MAAGYTIKLNSVELNQLLDIVCRQHYVADDDAIELVSKLNQALDSTNRGVNRVRNITEIDAAAIRLKAAEAYHGQRSQQIAAQTVRNGQHINGQHMNSRPELANGATALLAPTQPAQAQGALQKATEARATPTQADEPLLATIAMFAQVVTEHLTQQHQKLGFATAPSRRIVHCIPFRGALWHYNDDQNRPAPIQASSLTCLVQTLEFRQDQGRRGIWLTQLNVMGDRPYCLQCDYDSAFSRSLLMALATLSSRQIKQPITLEPTWHDSTQRLFCRVYSQGKHVMRPYDQNTSWREVTLQAVANIDQANGRVVAEFGKQAKFSA
ncbi:MAG: hypothetical protein AAGF24_05740 [Cyanobacteria bacterium P01_H01_bin.121]